MARRPGAPPRSRKTLSATIAYAGAKATGDEPPLDGDGSAAPADAPAPAAPKPDPGSETAAKKGEPKIEKAAPTKDEPATVETPEPAKVKPAEPPPAPAPPPPAPPPPAPVAEALGPIYEPLPRPKDIPVEDPEAPAPPPGPVPRGESRSFRRTAGGVSEFVLIYRYQTSVISRAGVVGKRGRWKVVEYPTMGSASHAYAQECSRLLGQGFADHRE